MTFQPFVVNCQTCGSTLRVTDPSIIGTIAACPKCQSMVRIDSGGTDSPAPRIAVGHSSVDSGAITEDAIAPVDIAANLSNGSGNGIASVDSIHQKPFAGQAISQDDFANSIPPAQAWQSERTARSRQIAMITALSISGLLISGAVFSWFVSAWQNRSVQTPVEPPDTDRVIEASGGETHQDVMENKVASVNLSADLGEDALAPEDVSVSASDPAALPESPTIARPDNSDPNASIPADLIPSSPLEPTPTDTASIDPGNKTDDLNPTPEQPPGLMELPPELAKYTEILLKNGALDSPTLEAPPTIDDVELDRPATDDDSEFAPTASREWNLRRDLGIRMAVSSDGYPLANLLLVTGQVTTVPMEIDWVSFDLAEMDTGAKIATPKGWRTAREFIDTLAASLDSQWLEEETLLVLSPTDERFAEVMSKISDLDDFEDGKESAVATLMTFLKPDAEPPETTLQIGSARHEQQLAAVSIEALRRMRAITGKVSDRHLNRWAVAAETEAIEWPLLTGGVVGPQFNEPISIAGFLLDVAPQPSHLPDQLA